MVLFNFSKSARTVAQELNLDKMNAAIASHDALMASMDEFVAGIEAALNNTPLINEDTVFGIGYKSVKK